MSLALQTRVLLHSQNGHNLLLQSIPLTNDGFDSPSPFSSNWSESRWEQFAIAKAVSLVSGSL